MNLAGVDLNLLVVFDALMVERNTTRAGERIGMSQPAVSKALNRLRHLCKDDLFIRCAEGMKPTPRAIELAMPVQQALQELSNALEPNVFDPATDARVFRILTNDLITRLMMPAVMERLDKIAPNIELHLFPDVSNALNRVEKNEVDMALITHGPLSDPFESEVLIEASESVVLMREGHPLSEGELTLDRLTEARHVVVTRADTDDSVIDSYYERYNIPRRVGITITQVIAGPAIVAASDLVMLVPRRLAAYQASFQNVVYREVPKEMPSFDLNVSMIWHNRLTANPAHRWLRGLLSDVAKEHPKYSRREYSQ